MTISQSSIIHLGLIYTLGYSFQVQLEEYRPLMEPVLKMIKVGVS